MRNMIMVIGSINMDYTTVVERLPEKGETILSKGFQVSPGGKGANQAAAATRLGGDVCMLGAIGKDDAGKSLEKILEREGMDVSALKEVDAPTGNALITVEDSGSNMIVVFSGANALVDVEQIQEHIDQMEKSNIVILQLEISIDSVVYAAKRAKEMGKTVILNPAPAAKLPDEIYPCIDYITPNETEIALLTGHKDVKEAANCLLEKGVQNIVVTLGEEGCLFVNKEQEIILPAFRVDPKDTTAAGDTFNGAFAVAIGEGRTVKEALFFASAAAGLSTEKLGAMQSIPSRKEVDEFIAKQKKIKRSL